MITLGEFELTLPLVKFPFLLSVERGVEFSAESFEPNQKLLGLLIHHRLIMLRVDFKDCQALITPKTNEYFKSILDNKAVKANTGVLRFGQNLIYEDPAGDAHLIFKTDKIEDVQFFMNSFPEYMPNLLEGVGTNYEKLEGSDLSFLASSSSMTASTLIGGLYLGKDLPLSKKHVSRSEESISFKGHQVLTPLLDNFLKRKSCRSYSESNLGAHKLFGLLDRISMRRPGTGNRKKLYPNGGAIHENEFFYLSLNTESLSSGLYYLNQEESLLEPQKGSDKKMGLIKDRMVPHSWDGHAQGYIIVTASIFKRMQKYSGMALRHALLNAGVIVDFIYVNCADLEIACCAHGSWSGSKFFSELVGTDFFESPIVAVVGVGVSREDNNN